MPYTMEDFNRQFVKKHFARLTPEERAGALKSLPPQERADVVKSLPPEQRADVVRSLPPEQRADVIKSLPPEELLACLTEEQIRQHLNRLSAERPTAPRKPRRTR